VKINYKNTALGLLYKIDPYAFRIISDGGETTMAEKTALCIGLIDKWPNMQPLFSKKIRYISDSFYRAYEINCHKLVDVLDAEDIDESGTFIFNASPSETNTIFYTIRTWGKGEAYEMDATVLIFNSDTKKDKPALGIVSQRRPGMTGQRFYASAKALKAGIKPIGVIADILTMILFFKYCDVETKVVESNKKTNHIGTKYVNETKSNIEIIDSTWFTTLVKSDGFHVRGHFRFQPCGQGLKDRKLIWVSDYDKDGYTREAKVLKQAVTESTNQ
jgi:hypothetical protein